MVGQTRSVTQINMLTYLRYFTITGILVFMGAFGSIAQEINDTIILTMHKVVASKSSAYHSGAQQEKLSALTLSRFENSSLGNALLENTLISIKNYGTPGSLSTASIRGLSSNHVQINWNGIAINSLTSGDFNLGLIPAGAFDEASFTPNASGALYGSGTFGGAIDLVSNTDTKKSSAMFSTEATSLNSISTLNKVKHQGENYSFSATAWFQNWKNNFDYYDTGKRKTLKRKNAEFSTNGMILTSAYKLNESQNLMAGLWLQEADKNLPSLNGTSPDKVEFQRDKTLRSFLNYKHCTASGILSGSAIYVNDYLRFGKKIDPNQELLSIDSKIRTIFYQGNADYQYYGFDNFKLIGGLLYKYAMPKSNNYAESLNEQQFSVFTSAKYTLKRFTTSLSLRKEFYSNYKNPFLLGMGGEYKLIEELVKIHFSVNQKYRIPTFNERFWQDAGNPDLKQEEGISYEAGVSLLPEHTPGNSQLDITSYYNQLDGLIRWLTVDGVLAPHVYSKVHAWGLEVRFRNNFSLARHIRMNNQTLFGYNRTTQEAVNDYNIDSKAQLPYTPKYKFTHTSYLYYKKLGLRFNYNYIGQQHYDETAWWLPSMHTMNLSLLFETSINETRTSFDFSVDNLRGVIHEHVKGYPAPGRIYRIKLNINI